jgi:hypothetical protein
MRGPRWLVLVGCFLVSAFGVSAARAGGGGTIDGGTIRFSGAVVEPTCSIATMQSVQMLATSTAPVHESLQQSCANPAGAGVATNASPTYTVDVVHLSGAEPDQVLRYFAGYIRAAQASADPVLMTQTYN